MLIEVHADDLGLSPAINAAILSAYDEGNLDSASVIVNAVDSDAALEAAQQRPGLGLAVHLNLMEGRPILPAREVPLLVDARGELCRSFPELWRRMTIAPHVERADLRAQVRVEIAAQLRRFRQRIGEIPLRVDSHQHYHLIPPVLEVLLELHEEFPIASLRTTAEPFFVHLAGTDSASAYLGSNLAKHLLLRALSGRARPKLRRLGIVTNNRFVGLLFTGRMSPDVVARALAAMTGSRTAETVELLFHPGQATADEEPLWRRTDLRAFYRSDRRAKEAAALRSEALREVLSRFREGHAPKRSQ